MGPPLLPRSMWMLRSLESLLWSSMATVWWVCLGHQWSQFGEFALVISGHFGEFCSGHQWPLWWVLLPSSMATVWWVCLSHQWPQFGKFCSSHQWSQFGELCSGHEWPFGEFALVINGYSLVRGCGWRDSWLLYLYLWQCMFWFLLAFSFCHLSVLPSSVYSVPVYGPVNCAFHKCLLHLNIVLFRMICV